jgi:hypothetical protein
MSASDMQHSPMPKNRDSLEQDQFLTILSREDALARFEAALFPRAPLSEARPLECRRLCGAVGRSGAGR